MNDKQDPQGPPGGDSNQNAEEAETEHEDREYGLRRPRLVDDDEQQSDENEGSASERSQSTGPPESAG